MMKQTLEYINSILGTAQIPYCFMEWMKETIPNTYWTGSYTESESINEDGYQESTFYLTGVTVDTYLSLETTKDTIKTIFPSDGISHRFTDGSAVVLSYQSSYPIPSEDERIKRMEITILVQEWSVN